MNDIMMNVILFWARLHHALMGMNVFCVIGIVLGAMGIGFVVISICRCGGHLDDLMEKISGRRMS